MTRRTAHLTLMLTILFVAVATSACGGSGASVATASVSTADAWARPATAGGESAAYLTITNTGSSADTLLSASSPSAASVELHQTMTDASGMTGMASMDGLAIPAGGTVTLEPGAGHLMIMGLTSDLAPGDTIDLALVFQTAGTVTVKAQVKQP